MKITGELLKSERLKKNLSLQDIALAIKLNTRIIDAIENGKTEDLPAKTFIRGFVKSYADFLKLDTELILKQFQEEMGSTLLVQKNIEQISEGKKTSPTFSAKNLDDSKISNKNILSFVAIAVLVIIIGIVNKITTRYQNEIPENKKIVEQSIAADTATSATTEVAAVDTNSTNSTLDNGSTNNLNTSIPPNDSNQNGVNTSDSQGIPQTAQTTTASSTSTSIANQASVSSTQVNNPTLTTGAKTALSTSSTTTAIQEKSKGQPVEILIEAKKDAFVSYAKGNTQEFKKLIIKANTFQIIKSSTGLHIKAEDGSSINLTVNGVNKGQPSTSSKPVEMTY